MHNSTKDRSAIGLLSSLEPSKNALLFYDNNDALERFLFHYVKFGLQKGETIFYWTGIRAIEEAEQRMSNFGIDCDYYERNGLLSLTSYDDMLLVDGKVDHMSCFRKLHKLRSDHNGKNIRLATESNWFLLADVFEEAFEVEAGHEVIPQNMSVVCSYNIVDLMKYANVYHIAKLMELHDDTLVANKGSVMLPLQFYSYLGKCITNVLEEGFDFITTVRKKHSRFISEVLSELELRIGSDMVELERKVEEKLRHLLKLETNKDF